MSNFLPACWPGLGGEQREKKEREEGLAAWRPLSYSGCNSCCVCGRSALFQDFKEELGFQDDLGGSNEMQVLNAGKEGVFAGLKRAALLALGAL